jgi:protocatechuate 3,4-dioxygenase beta subunit
VVAETITDADGRFLFGAFWKAHERTGFYTVSLFARDRTGRSGWRSNVSETHPPVEAIELAETVEFRGRLIDEAGRPIAGVELVPTLFAKVRWVSDFVYLSRSVALRHAARTAGDGTFAFRDIPERVEITFTIHAPAFGSPAIRWLATGPVEISLDGRLGRVRGRITPNAAPGAEGRMGVILALDSGVNLPGKPYALNVIKETQVAADGSFQFDGVSPGRYSIQAATPLGGLYESEHLYNVQVNPRAEVAGLELKLRRSLVITGRVVDAESGNSLPGVDLVAELGQNPLAHSWLPRATTDAQGRYGFFVSPGIVRIVPGPTSTHTGLRSDVWPRMQVNADQRWPDLKLARAAVVSGVAVDGAGRPVADANVFVITADNVLYGLSGPAATTQPDGSFQLKQLTPDDNVTVLARTAAATTATPVSIRLNQHQGPLRLTLGPTAAYRVRGTVTNRAGEPIEGAKALLWWGRYAAKQGLRPGASGALEECTTDAAGRFFSGALWPGERYKVTIDAEGFSEWDSPEVTGRAGGEHDFGRIMLVDVSGYVAGTVVDLAGVPLLNAAVFNRGDAPAQVETRTEARGRFRLDGLFPGGKYVFAHAAGYRFAAARV